MNAESLPTDDPDAPLRTRVARILESSDFPALSRQIIDTISTIDDSAASLQRLANVVLREYSLTVSVVRVANSAHYRRGARPIQSATHAMMMLGARTVRHLASSLLLFENYQRRSPALRELMVLSLLTANHAREVAVRTGAADPEEAHLCGMFRNLGEVLVACHFPEDYARIHELMSEHDMGLPRASQKVLGFRYEEIGAAISRHWGMPETVLQSIRTGRNSALSQIDAVTQFSHDLTTAIYREGPASGNARQALDQVLDQHGSRIRIQRDAVKEVVESALTETRELFASARVSMESLKLRQLSDAARAALGVETLEGEWDTPTSSPAIEPVQQVRTRLRDELEAKADPQSGAEVGEVLLLAEEALLRGGPFERVAMCLLNADRSRITARSALGDGADQLVRQFDFALSPSGGPVPALVLQRQPLYLPVDRAMNSAETRWAAQVGAQQFGVHPLIVANRIIGCMYFDRRGADTPNRATLQFVRDVGNLVVKAIEVRRRAATR